MLQHQFASRSFRVVSVFVSVLVVNMKAVFVFLAVAVAAACADYAAEPYRQHYVPGFQHT
jgi:hypothetical protein